MSWWNTNWQYRKKLAFDNSGQTENFINFPVLVKLTTSNFAFSKAQSAGQDIRFVDADESTELKYEIEKWTDNTEAWIWVKVPQVNGSSSTDYIWMYYGNSGASDGQDAPNVWDSHFKGVWHLNKTSGVAPDSTANNNDGTVTGATRGQTGKVDNCFDFDNTDDKVSVPDSVSLSITGNLTLEAWIQRDTNAGDADGIISKFSWTPSAKRSYEIIVWANKLMFQGSSDGSGTIQVAGTATLTKDSSTWYYVVAIYNGSTVKIYVNTTEDGSANYSSGFYDSDVALLLGMRNAASNSEPMGGLIDEARVSATARSVDWIKAQYLSMTLAFITFGSEQGNITSSDAGSGAESLGSRLFAVAEAGSGIGASSLLAALVGTEETGLGSEFATKIFTAFDSGSGIDAVISRLLAATETGSSMEVALLITVLISGDGGLGADLSTLLKAILAWDEGSGFDALKALIETTGSDMRLHARPGQVRIPSKGVNYES